MAQIDFSNAQLEMQSIHNYGVISQSRLWLFDRSWVSPNGVFIYPSSSMVVENTPTKYAVRYQGTIPSGISNANYISIIKDSLVVYKITGITYSSGDTYDFTIEVELTPS